MLHLPQTLPFLAGLCCFAGATVAQAGTATAQGDVLVLTDISSMVAASTPVDFNDGASFTQMPLDAYQDQGFTWHTGELSTILSGVSAPGTVFNPLYADGTDDYFPAPIEGGGSADGIAMWFGGAVTFDSVVTQVGLTISANGTQYLTAWDTSGTMIGQVTWQPSGNASFIGLDTQNVPIGMFTLGNDDLWNGETSFLEGSTAISDNWISGSTYCYDADDCADDGNPCTDAVCTNHECTPAFNTASCDDQDACTDDDTCSEGACAGVALECDDDDPCSSNSCDSTLGCVFDAIDQCCADDSACPADEVCGVETHTCEPAPAGTTGSDSDGGETGGGETGGDNFEFEPGVGSSTGAGSTSPTGPDSNGGVSSSAGDTDAAEADGRLDDDGLSCSVTGERTNPFVLFAGFALLGLRLRRRTYR